MVLVAAVAAVAAALVFVYTLLRVPHRVIPAGIGDLSRLHELRLSANGPKHVPPLSIARLDMLTTLWLQNNRLALLPEDMGLHLHRCWRVVREGFCNRGCSGTMVVRQWSRMPCVMQ